jgi:hypothetical protein
VAFQAPPQRHWRSYGTDPLPTAAEAVNEPFRAFPSWFLRIECDRCGKVAMVNEAHTTGRRREMPIRALLAPMRHDGCRGSLPLGAPPPHPEWRIRAMRTRSGMLRWRSGAWVSFSILSLPSGRR